LKPGNSMQMKSLFTWSGDEFLRVDNGVAEFG